MKTGTRIPNLEHNKGSRPQEKSNRKQQIVMPQPLQIKTPKLALNALLDLPQDPKALMILTHGAGAGITHNFMGSLAQFMQALGIAVLRFNFPYWEKGRRSPGSPKEAINSIQAAQEQARDRLPGLPVFIGGKSYGGRMASHLLAEKPELEINGLVFFGFPLHAPGRDSTERAAHLTQVQVPMLFLQGDKDKLANIDLIRKVTSTLDMTTLKVWNGADHSFKVPKSQGTGPEEMIGQLAQKAADWMKEKI